MTIKGGVMIKLKIGRGEYSITSDDTFMDNGSCVQLTSKRNRREGSFINPVLSKRAVKEISGFKRMQLQHGYGDEVQLFSLDIPQE